MQPYPSFIDPIPHGDPPRDKNLWDADTGKEIPVGDPPPDWKDIDKPVFDHYFRRHLQKNIRNG